MTSRTTRSVAVSRAARTPLSPSAAVATVNPSPSRYSRSSLASSASSSTTSSRATSPHCSSDRPPSALLDVSLPSLCVTLRGTGQHLTRPGRHWVVEGRPTKRSPGEKDMRTRNMVLVAAVWCCWARRRSRSPARAGRGMGTRRAWRGMRGPMGARHGAAPGSTSRTSSGRRSRGSSRRRGPRPRRCARSCARPRGVCRGAPADPVRRGRGAGARRRAGQGPPSSSPSRWPRRAPRYSAC